MIGEWDDGGAHPEDHGRVDLAVGVRGAVDVVLLAVEVVRRHGDHGRLLLQTVDVLHHARRHQVVPAEVTVSYVSDRAVLRTLGLHQTSSTSLHHKRNIEADFMQIC